MAGVLGLAYIPVPLLLKGGDREPEDCNVPEYTKKPHAHSGGGEQFYMFI